MVLILILSKYDNLVLTSLAHHQIKYSVFWVIAIRIQTRRVIPTIRVQAKTHRHTIQHLGAVGSPPAIRGVYATSCSIVLRPLGPRDHCAVTLKLPSAFSGLIAHAQKELVSCEAEKCTTQVIESKLRENWTANDHIPKIISLLI